MLPKPSKKFATRYIQALLPDYGEMLAKIRKDGGWVNPQSWLGNILNKLQISDYAKYYTIENVVDKAFYIAMFDPDDFQELNAELEQASVEERTMFLDEWIAGLEQDDQDLTWDFSIPKTPEEEQIARELFDALSKEEQVEICKRAVCFWVFYMISFYDYFSMMVHGKKITQLITEAIKNDDDALVLAAQIDPSVMRYIPYFQEREDRAYREGDITFLDKLAYRKRIPPLQGKIRFPLLYLLFAMLDGMNILDDLKGSELLGICDSAGLDRWQNRIQDVGCLNKRKTEYRKFQKIIKTA